MARPTMPPEITDPRLTIPNARQRVMVVDTTDRLPIY